MGSGREIFMVCIKESFIVSLTSMAILVNLWPYAGRATKHLTPPGGPGPKSTNSLIGVPRGPGSPQTGLRLWGGGPGSPQPGLRLWGGGPGSPQTGLRLWGGGPDFRTWDICLRIKDL